MACKLLALLALIVSFLHVVAYSSAGRGYRRYHGGNLLLRALAAAYLAVILNYIATL